MINLQSIQLLESGPCVYSGVSFWFFSLQGFWFNFRIFVSFCAIIQSNLTDKSVLNVFFFYYLKADLKFAVLSKVWIIYVA